MIGVAKHQLQSKLADQFTIECLEGAIGADGHKIGRVDAAMRGIDSAHASAGFAGLMNQLKTKWFYHLKNYGKKCMLYRNSIMF